MFIIFSVFVGFYTVHGVLRERKYELYVQVVAILVILLYCIVEYSVNSEGRKTIKLVICYIFVILLAINKGRIYLRLIHEVHHPNLAIIQLRSCRCLWAGLTIHVIPKWRVTCTSCIACYKSIDCFFHG